MRFEAPLTIEVEQRQCVSLNLAPGFALARLLLQHTPRCVSNPELVEIVNIDLRCIGSLPWKGEAN